MSIHSGRFPLLQQGSYSTLLFPSTRQHSIPTFYRSPGVSSKMTVRNGDVCDAAIISSHRTHYLFMSLAVLVSCLAAFATQYRALPTLGFAHFLVDLRRLADARHCGYRCVSPSPQKCVRDPEMRSIQDLLWDLHYTKRARDDLGLRGVKGTTGTRQLPGCVRGKPRKSRTVG